MNEIVIAEPAGPLAVFEPRKARMIISGIQGAIKQAKAMRDWAMGEAAIEELITMQTAFVAWWDATVTPGRAAGLAVSNPVVANRGQPQTLSVAEATAQTGIRKQQVSRWRERLHDLESYRLTLRETLQTAALATAGNVRTQGSGNDEWYTPDLYPSMARAVMGGIDLDPATHSVAQETIQAKKYFSEADNGLLHEWHGRVFLNPPYAQPLMAQFVSKMCAEVRAERVTAGIMLTNNCTDTTWFSEAASLADAIAFTHGRIKFYQPDRSTAAPTQGQCFFYFGNDVPRFGEIFQTIGLVVVRWSRSAATSSAATVLHPEQDTEDAVAA